MQDYVGKQIDRYWITKRLGMGGMAVVYKAYDTRLERNVAIKFIRTEAIPQEQHGRLLARFEREARSQAKFSHPHIVPVFDYGEIEGVPYLVMEYVEGGTLKDLTGRKMEWEKAVNIIVDIADALQYAHQMGVIHRDIKPGNILMDVQGRPFLSDFGIAKTLEDSEPSLTSTGLGVGTPEYMAPEQWQAQTSAYSDQYALGVVLYELLTGQKPFTAETPVAIALKQLNDPLVRPKNLNPDIPDGLEKIIFKVLAKDPGDRYQDLAAFCEAIERVKTGNVDVDVDEFELDVKQVAGLQTIEPERGIESETIDRFVSVPVVSQPIDALSGTKKASRIPKWMMWVAGIMLVSSFLLASTIILWFWIDKPGQKGVATTSANLLLGSDNGEAGVETSNPVVLSEETPTPEATIAPTETIAVTSTTTLGVGTIKVNTQDDASLVFIPAGEFVMGSNAPEAWEHESPQHQVYLDSFWIYQYPVTNQQFAQFVDLTGHQTTAEKRGTSFLSIDGGWVDTTGVNWKAPEGIGSNIKAKDSYPVIHVSWFDAYAYCKWAEGRLPSEAEWEKAARGEDGRRYPWGNTKDVSGYANYCDIHCPHGNADNSFNDGFPLTSPVGSFVSGVSPYGAHDMAGNVWEWIADWYSADYYQQSPHKNPSGPSSGERRVIRGGSWCNGEGPLRTSFRNFYDPNHTFPIFGFRCVQDSTP